MKKVFGFLSTLILFLTVSSAFAAATSDQYLAAGNTLYQQKDYTRAITYYKAAIQVDPSNAAAHTRLANTYYMLGQKQEALGEYQAALNLNPNNAQLADFVQKLRAQLGGGAAPAPGMASSPSSMPDEKGLYLGGGLGIDVPMTQGVTTMGFGPEIFGGYAFDKNFSIRLEIDVLLSSPATQLSEMEIRPIAEVKYTFDGNGMQPYLLGGIGYDMASESSGGVSASASGLDYAIGGGLQFDLGNKLKGWVELKYNGDSLSSGSSSSSGSGASAPSVSFNDVPITAGIMIPLS